MEWLVRSQAPLTAENSGSRRHSVEFYTLHLHLQHWRLGIWHTTPIPAGAWRLHTEQWNFTPKHFWPLMFQPHWFGRNWEKNIYIQFLLQGFMTSKPLQLYLDFFFWQIICVVIMLFYVYAFSSVLFIEIVWGIRLFAFVYLMPLFCTSVTNVSGWMRFFLHASFHVSSLRLQPVAS